MLTYKLRTHHLTGGGGVTDEIFRPTEYSLLRYFPSACSTRRMVQLPNEVRLEEFEMIWENLSHETCLFSQIRHAITLKVNVMLVCIVDYAIHMQQLY